ncbi:AmmeMemoRadiSam system protein B [candidate division KSB1 bacterium]
MLRSPAAPQFYAGNIERQISGFLSEYNIPNDLNNPVAGIVPHAGWMYSGSVAAKVFSSFKELNQPESIILFGAVHNSWHVKENSLFPEGAWNTPLGDVKIDSELADIIIEESNGLIIENPSAHDGEHSLEVQLPFIKYFFPDAAIVPIAVLPDQNAVEVGKVSAKAIEKYNKTVVAVGSSDLTHYGENYGFAPAGSGMKAKEWMEENDRKIIEKALKMDAEQIVETAVRNHCACGSGAMAAATAFAIGCGAEKGILLEYITSFDVSPEPQFNLAVGYAGIVFDK